MSYLNNVRLIFSGKFQADTSTVNNDVTHYDNANFKPEYQEYGKGATNGWWNPCGSGAFRLIDCKVEEVGYASGTTVRESNIDPVIGMLIGGSNQRVSGKMVDLDPQMQMLSEIWGLDMRLTDGQNDGFFSGRFKPTPFRDILFGRQQGHDSGDQTATAIYQSVLENVNWEDVDTSGSRFLQELKRLSEKTGKLSVRMMVYSYSMDHTSPNFTIGHVSGVIGPALEDEPDSFILGRRFAPKNGSSTAQNINFFDAKLNLNQDGSAGNLIVDLSNALPLLNGDGQFVDIGQIQLVVLKGDFDEGATQLSDSLYTPIGGPIPYLSMSNNWMKQSGALFNVDNITGSTLYYLTHNPLALMRMDNKEILIRETPDGLLVRADQVVHRINPSVKATTSVDFYAARYGKPVAQTINISLPDQSNANNDPNVPVINCPADKIAFNAAVTTNAQGKAVFNCEASAPGNPRGYIDGQLFLLSYTPAGAGNYIQYFADIIANLVFDDFDVPDTPTWTDIKPTLTQFGNLYPVMSKMLVDLGSYESVVQYRSILELAFTRPIDDPNYMPVTRDLCEGKRKTIIKWLTAKDENGHYTLLRGDEPAATDSPIIEPCNACRFDSEPAAKHLNAVTAIQTSVTGSKQLAAQNFKQNMRK
ncbi:MAG: hypothetical protein OIF57_03130 [Marinobacterium sp.]|nr:hypothetical protein [Marinobacterium sp.]